ncbi:anaerobic ribonucleoside-triphosphate reductase [Candidatus Desulforudis audaxviator MP104C]|uniref:Anaerobic ribonucleoside-triphosphate reductase n=1 Tax=Desulforudis audaxviator (strain MP104C) TaxID=477974 RepID=B1I637_DESAP|nr:ribonucleoside triphosphate reductase [Candidatus Desulforudis audaxviator]ACA60486.1 anaerobic ribonucleoside-triphosphate reductase [Candidatus Desulforudis audaxviator MP104C]
MITSIKKRDGRIAAFESRRITNAIAQAFKATGEAGWADDDAAPAVTQRVIEALENRGIATPTVEEVQDLVERSLMELGYHRTAKAYILYREQHRQMREMKSLVNCDLVESYLNQADWRVAENANSSFSLQGLHSYISNTAAASFWLERIYPPEVRRAHLEGDFHIHDLGYLSVYCVGWDLKQLLEEGFGGVPNQVSSKPPKHFRSALGQMVNFLYTLQGEAAGAQAFSNVDTLLAPFVRADNLSYREVKQAIQEFVFNLNVPTRTGYQTPFTNITMDLDIPAFMQDEPAVVGGRELDTGYGDYQEEVNMINEAFADVLMEGDACGRGFTFPIPTYNVSPEFNWGGPVAQKLFAVTAKYGTPYFANFINSDLQPEDVRSMCCRLRIDNKQLLKRGGGLFGASPLTGSIGVVTLNLPRSAYLAKDEQDFFTRLAHLASIAVTSLEIKRRVLERLTGNGLYPYSRHYLRGVKERTGNYWTNHFATIGLVGAAEAARNLLGKSISEPEGQEFARRILIFLREFLVGVQERTGNLYNLEATPAEGCSHRLARIDKREFPGLLAANEDEWRRGAAPYYTNSTQLPVHETDDVFAMFEHQEPLQTLYTGGTVAHIFLGEALPDPEGCAALVKKVTNSYRLPYVSVTPTYSVCASHGYISGEARQCPRCGGATEIYSRIVGYYRPVSQWNEGKKAEYGQRRVFRVPQSLQGILLGRL